MYLLESMRNYVGGTYLIELNGGAKEHMEEAGSKIARILQM